MNHLKGISEDTFAKCITPTDDSIPQIYKERLEVFYRAYYRIVKFVQSGEYVDPAVPTIPSEETKLIESLSELFGIDKEK